MLVDGQYVRLYLSGFSPYTGVNFRQCVAAPVDPNTDCTPFNSQVTPYVGADGGGNTYLPVYAGDNPKLRTPASIAGGATSCANNACIPCDVNHACSIQTRYHVGAIFSTVLTAISFAPTPDFCPPIGPDSILGTGSSGAARVMYTWTTLVCGPPRHLNAQFASYSSGRAYSDFFAGETDFGITGIRPSAPTEPGFEYKLAPVSATAVVLAYRMYSRGSQITNLTLTPKIVADLFSGRINGFNNSAEIRSINPGVYFPPRQLLVARGDQSSENYEFTSWLAAAAPAAWTSGAGHAGPSESFPLINGTTTGKTGEMADGLAVVDASTDFGGQGNLGVMYASTAAFYGLPTVQILQPDGTKVSATSDAIIKGVNDATANGDGTLTPKYVNTVHPDAYPMPALDYVITPTNRISPTKGQQLQGFLRYAVQDGQGVLPAGYAPLPAALVARSLHIADLIPTLLPVGLPAPLPTGPVPGGGQFAPFGTGGAQGPSASDALRNAAAGSKTFDGVVAGLSWRQGKGLRALIKLEGGRLAHLALPIMMALAAFSLVAGVGLQLLGRWVPIAGRRP